MPKICYPAIFRKTDNGGYSAYIPDLPECHAEAPTLDETYSRVLDTLVFCVRIIKNADGEIPKPSNVIYAEDSENSFIIMVQLELTPGYYNHYLANLGESADDGLDEPFCVQLKTGGDGAENTKLCYPAIFRKTSDGYSAYTPDLPECQANAASLDEAYNSVLQQLDFCIRIIKNANGLIPQPSESCELDDADHAFIIMAQLELPSGYYDHYLGQQKKNANLSAVVVESKDIDAGKQTPVDISIVEIPIEESPPIEIIPEEEPTVEEIPEETSESAEAIVDTQEISLGVEELATMLKRTKMVHDEQTESEAERIAKVLEMAIRDDDAPHLQGAVPENDDDASEPAAEVEIADDVEDVEETSESDETAEAEISKSSSENPSYYMEAAFIDIPSKAEEMNSTETISITEIMFEPVISPLPVAQETLQVVEIEAVENIVQPIVETEVVESITQPIVEAEVVENITQTIVEAEVVESITQTVVEAEVVESIIQHTTTPAKTADPSIDIMKSVLKNEQRPMMLDDDYEDDDRRYPSGSGILVFTLFIALLISIAMNTYQFFEFKKLNIAFQSSKIEVSRQIDNYAGYSSYYPVD